MADGDESMGSSGDLKSPDDRAIWCRHCDFLAMMYEVQTLTDSKKGDLMCTQPMALLMSNVDLDTGRGCMSRPGAKLSFGQGSTHVLQETSKDGGSPTLRWRCS